MAIHSFKLVSSYSRKDQRRGGVCILIKPDVEFENIDWLNSIAMEKHFEICGIKMKQHHLNLFCLYRTPDSDINMFFRKLQILLDKMCNKDKYKNILCGNFNIDFLNDSKYKNTIIDILHNYDLKIHITKPTRQNSCIDNIISDIKNAKGETHELGLSDHNTGQTLSINLKMENNISRKHWFAYKRDLSKENIEKFNDCIGKLSFSEVYLETDVNKAFSLLHDEICLFYELCFPLIKVKMNSSSLNLKWITKGLKKSFITKRKLQSTYYKSKTTQNKLKYKKYSKRLRQCVNTIQRQNNKTYIGKADNKCKATWENYK